MTQEKLTFNGWNNPRDIADEVIKNKRTLALMTIFEKKSIGFFTDEQITKQEKRNETGKTNLTLDPITFEDAKALTESGECLFANRVKAVLDHLEC